MDLKCKKLNCEYNDKYSCMKKAMFETAPDFHPYRHKKKVDIECDAECLFNRNHECHANGISVCSCTNCALCTTFIKD